MQLLLAWFHSHFWKVDKVSYWVFSENYSPLKEIVAIPRQDLERKMDGNSSKSLRRGYRMESSLDASR
ncbi:hypothetical protein Gotur_024112 [Gossypium turneri]